MSEISENNIFIERHVVTSRTFKHSGFTKKIKEKEYQEVEILINNHKKAIYHQSYRPIPM